MTRTRYRIVDDAYPHFITCTIVGWLPVFTRTEAVDIIYDSWRHLINERELTLFGYVILENHLHLIAGAPKLGEVMQSFKSFTAGQIIELLKKHSASVLLRQLREHKSPERIESTYQVWQPGGKPKQIIGGQMMRQKLNYVHNNPVKRGYVDEAVHWRYSSARNYAGMPGLIDVTTDWQ